MITNNLTSLASVNVLKQFSILTCQGQDVKNFLQGQLTCNVNELSDEQTQLGCYCDHKGRVQATFYLWKNNATYYLITPTTVASHLLNELKKFAAFSKIIIQEVTSEFHLIGNIGNPNQLCDLLENEYPKNPYQVTHQKDHTIINIPGIVSRLLIIKKELPDLLTADDNPWQLIDIFSGIAFITKQTIGLFTPHDLNYQLIGAIHFKKGCYRGQEIVARMHYRGKLKQHLYHAVSENLSPSPGMPLVDINQNAVGTIVNSVTISNGSHLLVCLQQSAKKDDFVFFNGDTKTPLKFLSLPYEIPED